MLLANNLGGISMSLINLECRQSLSLCDDYKISPLLDFLNIYKCQCAKPKICEAQSVYFRNNVHNTYTDVDITCIVSAWMENKIENKGLILKGIDNAGLITYASNRYCLFGMRPIIRLIYNDTFCNSWETVPCIVNVKK